MNKAVFFDRDGVINIDYGYVGTIDRFNFLPGVPTALCKLRKAGFLLVLVTNQSGIARGKYTEADFHKVTSYMQSVLSMHDAAFDKVLYCPHHPNAQIEKYKIVCECRKPKSGMFLEAKNALNIDMNASIMIGDHASDLVAAYGSGINQLVLVGEHQEEAEKLDKKVIQFQSVAAFATDYDKNLQRYSTIRQN